MRFVLWLATLLFFVAFFSYGYVLWVRAKKRRAARTGTAPSTGGRSQDA